MVSITRDSQIYTLILLLIVGLAACCEQIREGCKAEGFSCVCGSGCYTEYRYNTKEECRRALKGRRNRDICFRNPCFNNGACSQTSHEPGYRCRCEGTGFYGARCQYDCTQATNIEDSRFPYECVVI